MNGCKSPIEVRTVNDQIFPTYRAACEALGLLAHWKAMADDISTKVSEQTGIPDYYVNTPELQGYILYEIEVMLNGFGKLVKDFGMPTPLQHLLEDLTNKLLMEEKNYKRDMLRQVTLHAVSKLNSEQRKIYDLIMNATSNDQQELIFIYGHGGTRKMFLWKTIISSF
nr:DNA helicase [Tanacetum cinerariifolium]